MLLLSGFGFCCLQMGGVVSCQLYFNLKRSFALGIAMTGIGLGAFAWPPLTAWLIGLFSWKGTVLIIAAIQMHAYICAAIIRPVRPQDINTTLETRAMVELPADEETGHIDKLSGSTGMGVPNNNQAETNTERPALEHLHCEGETTSLTGQESGKLDEFERLTTTCKKDESKEGGIDTKTSKAPATFVFCDKLLLKDPGYWAFMFGQYFEQVGHYVPFTYLPLRGLHIGYDEQTSAFLVTCLAISSVSTRILVGYLGDRIGHRRVYVTGVAIGAAGLASALSFFCNSYGSLAGYGVVFGCISGIHAAWLPSLLGAN